MTGRMLVAEAAAGARMNKGKIVMIAVVSVLAVVLLTAAVVSMARYAGPQLHAFFGSDNFLMVCVVTHLTSLCILARLAATAPTLAERRYYAESTIPCAVHLAANLYLAVVAGPRRAKGGA